MTAKEWYAFLGAQLSVCANKSCQDCHKILDPYIDPDEQWDDSYECVVTILKKGIPKI